LPLFTAGIVAFTPKFTWISAVLNSDTLVWLFSTITIFLMLKLTRNFNNYKFIILLGIFLGLANISKSNAFILYPVLLVLFSYLIFYRKVEFKNALKKFAIIILISLPAGAWYIIHKFYITLDPTNISISYILRTLGQARTSPISESYLQSMPERLINFDLLHFRIIDMLWSNLGWHVITTPLPLTLIGNVGLILILSGLILFLFKKNKFKELRLKRNDLIIILSSSIFSLASMIFYVIRGGTGDVRYTFPFISIFAVLVTIGIYPYLKKMQLKFLLIIPIIFLIIINASLIDTMDSKFVHGFKEIQIDVFLLLIDEYNDRPDLQKEMPEVKNGDLKRLFVWAEKHGMHEKSLLKNHEALFVIINTYYSKPELQSQFPEVIQNHDLTNLIKWSITEGIDKQVIPEKYFSYLTRYNQD